MQPMSDVSYNSFTGSVRTSCQKQNVNLASSFLSAKSTWDTWCWKKDLPCSNKAKGSRGTHVAFALIYLQDIFSCNTYFWWYRLIMHVVLAVYILGHKFILNFCNLI